MEPEDKLHIFLLNLNTLTRKSMAGRCQSLPRLAPASEEAKEWRAEARSRSRDELAEVHFCEKLPKILFQFAVCFLTDHLCVQEVSRS